MKKIRVKGKSVEDAIDNGSKILGVPKDKLVVNVLSEGKSGVLGVFGGEDAEVELREDLPVEEVAKEILQELINKLDVVAICEVESIEDGFINLDIKGEDLGKLIGKDGNMLMALQIVLSSMVGRVFNQRVRLGVDAGGYKSKREEVLVKLAKDAAKDVIESGIEKNLPPMTAGERRAVHLALQENPSIKTFSRGEGADRRLVISPANSEG